jgi:hypothetical protein
MMKNVEIILKVSVQNEPRSLNAARMFDLDFMV